MTRVGHYFLGLRKDTLPWLFIIFFLIVIMAAGWYVLRPAFQSNTTLQLGDAEFSASTTAINRERMNDAINTVNLLPDQAVLLMYDSAQMTPVTVQVQAAAVDLVWLDSDKRVVYIVKNISRATIDQFTPSRPARYIIELAAGTVTSKAITVGMQATFNEHSAGGF